jgi:putative oxidoreductase
VTDHLQNPLALVGRILLALMFVLAGFSKIAGFAGTVGYMQSKGMPMAAVLAALTIVLEVGGGLALMFGLWTRWAALALAGFTLLATFIFHNFWAVPEAQRMVQNLMFMKNISIVGGMLALAAFGPGAWSLDARRTGAGRYPAPLAPSR